MNEDLTVNGETALWFTTMRGLNIHLGEYGRLYETEDGSLAFEGKLEESAKVFMEHICNNYKKVEE